MVILNDFGRGSEARMEDGLSLALRVEVSCCYRPVFYHGESVQRSVAGPTSLEECVLSPFTIGWRDPVPVAYHGAMTLHAFNP